LHNALNVAKEAQQRLFLLDMDISAIMAHTLLAGDAFTAQHAARVAEMSATAHNLIDLLRETTEALQSNIDQLHRPGG
jgi:hypothetical protein